MVIECVGERVRLLAKTATIEAIMNHRQGSLSRKGTGRPEFLPPCGDGYREEVAVSSRERMDGKRFLRFRLRPGFCGT